MIRPGQESALLKALASDLLSMALIYAPASPNSWAKKTIGSGGSPLTYVEFSSSWTLSGTVILCPTQADRSAGAPWGEWNVNYNGNKLELSSPTVDGFSATNATDSAFATTSAEFWVVSLDQLRSVFDPNDFPSVSIYPGDVQTDGQAYYACQFDGPPTGECLGAVLFDRDTNEIYAWVDSPQCVILEGATLPSNVVCSQSSKLMQGITCVTSRGVQITMNSTGTNAGEYIGGTGDVLFKDRVLSPPKFPKTIVSDPDLTLTVNWYAGF